MFINYHIAKAETSPKKWDNAYRFGFNGQEKVNEVAGIGNHNTAMFWEYDTRLGKRWNIDPKRNMSISPYSAFQNNPILFSDVNGDSVSLGNTYDKNDKGQLLYPDKVRQFELFASTNEGRAYLLDHAQKGFSLKGEIVKDLDIQASEEGAASASGVDITFKVGEVSSIAGAATSSHFVGGINKSHGARLKTEFIFPNKNMKYFTRPGEADISGVGSYAHETLLHGSPRRPSSPRSTRRSGRRARGRGSRRRSAESGPVS